MSVDSALAASAAAPKPQRAEARVAMVAGAVGRRGEALLNRVLASGDYAEVVAVATGPIAPGMRGLRLVAPEAFDGLPRIDDLFLLLSDSEDAQARSYYGRDASFMLVDETNCLAIAERAVARGARRAVLLSPMPAWQQVGRFHRGLANATELALAQLPLQSLEVLRPVREARRKGGGLVERFVAAYLSLQLLMLPKSIPIVTSETLARAALQAMRESAGGVQVHDADALAGLLERTHAAVPRPLHRPRA